MKIIIIKVCQAKYSRFGSHRQGAYVPALILHSQDSPGCIKYNVMDKSTVSYYWRMLIIAKRLEYKVKRIDTIFLIFQMHMFIIQICNHGVFAKQPKNGVYTVLLKAFNGMGG